ncbi:ATP phosphoribosyltransferase regulatory subunit [Polynucleobacter paneuropaeus]|uniref:ATP phosphoribosyltransferase regulatory subunit n=1 Tax=Polynucleobacter paneuropaeus TaxID=2527775 RepID=A0AAE2YJK0_9BURK|nr:ATP phosphoribosyltransferase regulatory subunit [Polynucleobacter paneuropaeus]MBT8590680.1 ATP phosphoribosyltransferase regulatory subunit [Polynucleobacter paneuropaeus]MBT8596057.1 ATP phosphoribosyltransferase regulatory subunit [Polynucleobacter paneuropaeus]MBT8597883.1 ATP phosphoribosyltransferase regulatory subunit [Polynucleobacter paneuropaeus]QWD24043.1 ATP phosphoribosyltransferase regulatory subunit [Polynucleobacter paneuropaeus]
MNRWLLPEDIADVLPAQARKVETLRRNILDLYQSYGYELVAPPILEFLDSLLTGTGSDLNLQTFKLVDQLSGRTLGLRADITPQVARIDAHLLNREGVTRLCYAGSVAHARTPVGSTAREELQLGAEIYGCVTWQADLEAITLLLKTLSLAGLDKVYLDLSHAGILNGILAKENLASIEMEALYGLLQSKDRPRLSVWAKSLPEQTAKALLALTELNGPCAEVLNKAKTALPQTPEVKEALAQLAHLIESASDLSKGLELSIDLADLRGYQYHSGVMFAAYIDKLPQPIARGGRYDQVGKAFGRARPATGFSLDLLTLASLSPNQKPKKAILAPWDNDAQLKQAIDSLRQAGEVIIQLNAGEPMQSAEYVCDRELVKQGGKWSVSQK